MLHWAEPIFSSSTSIVSLAKNRGLSSVLHFTYPGPRGSPSLAISWRHNGGTQPPSPWPTSEAVRPAHETGVMRCTGPSISVGSLILGCAAIWSYNILIYNHIPSYSFVNTFSGLIGTIHVQRISDAWHPSKSKISRKETFTLTLTQCNKERCCIDTSPLPSDFKDSMLFHQRTSCR